MDIKLIDIEKIHVNVLNPRYIEQESEEHEIEQIIKNGDLEKLMNDIAKYGLDPSENLLLTYDADLDSYIVHEGNRRITALKLLNTPELVPISIDNRDAYISKIKKIITLHKYEPIRKVRAVIMDDYELMNHFIEIKHIRNHGGAGRKDWKPEDQTRFNNLKDPFKYNLLRCLTQIIPGKTNDFNFTTIERVINDPDMRNALDLVINKKTGKIEFKSLIGYQRFKYIVEGLSNKTFTVKNFYYKEDRQNFIQNHFTSNNNEILSEESNTESIVFELEGNNDNSDNKEVNNQITLEEINQSTLEVNKQDFSNIIPITNSIEANEGNVQQINKDTEKKRNIRQPEPKKRPYFFHGVNYSGENYGIKHSLYEIHRIESKTFLLSTTMLFRTLFECTIQQYILVNNININSKQPIESLSIQNLLKICADNSNGNFKTLEKHNKTIARILAEAYAQKDHDELNIVTHGNLREPSYVKLEDIERRWYEAIKIMLGEISGQN